jgi:N6-adenosine-specific RNA methylase IME4
MTMDEIRALPVGEIAAKDCQLWLWTTNTHLFEVPSVLKTWGFTYKVTATWVKNRMGLGYWLRGRTEHLVLAVRGNPRGRMRGPHGATGFSWDTLVDEREIEFDHTALVLGPVREHSKKPDASYEMIEAMSEESRLEMFARRARSGWTAWGDEAPVAAIPGA